MIFPALPIGDGIQVGSLFVTEVTGVRGLERELRVEVIGRRRRDHGRTVGPRDGPAGSERGEGVRLLSDLAEGGPEPERVD